MPTSLRNLKPDELNRLSQLATISKILNTSYDVDELLTRMLDSVLECLGAQRGFIIFGRGERRKIAVTRGIEREKQSSYSRTVVEQVLQTGAPLLSTDVGQDVRFTGSESLRDLKVRSVICAPLTSRNQTIGAIYLDSLASAGIFRPSDGEMLEILCEMSVAALERAHYFNRTLEAEAKQRTRLKQVIQAATGGKLKVLERAELDELLQPMVSELVVGLNSPEDVAQARQETEKLFAPKLSPPRLHDLVLCVSEGATNVVRHGGGGSVSLGLLDDRALAYFVDQGPGIDPDFLPQATLGPGFSTKTSLGFGFSVILQLLDAIWLHTEPTGTHLVLQLALENGRSYAEELAERLCQRLEVSGEAGPG